MDRFIIQAIGIIGMLSTVISFQCKSNRSYFIFQAGCSIFFFLQFLLMGAWTGILFNAMGIVRAFLFRARAGRSVYALVGLEAYLAIAAVVSLFVLKEPWLMVALVVLAQAVSTAVMWTNNGKAIRIMQLTVSSPCWMTYDLLLPVPSIGGILCEIFNIASVLISFVRFRKTGFEKAHTR